MSNPSKKAKTSKSGGPFAKRPREMLVWILEFFSMHEVAGLQRLVCLEFRDAGQERIYERGGRKLYEEGIAYLYGSIEFRKIKRHRLRIVVVMLVPHYVSGRCLLHVFRFHIDTTPIVEQKSIHFTLI